MGIQLISISTQDKHQHTKMSTEQTFIAVKPDGVQRGLVGEIIGRFERRGYKLAAIKLVTPSKEHLEKHYEDLKGKPFFPGLISSAPPTRWPPSQAPSVATSPSMLAATSATAPTASTRPRRRSTSGSRRRRSTPGRRPTSLGCTRTRCMTKQ